MRNFKTAWLLFCIGIAALIVGLSRWISPPEMSASSIIPPAYSTIQNGGTPITQRQTVNMTFSAGAGSCSDSGGISVCNFTGTTTGSVSTGVTLTNGQLVLGAGASAIKVGDLTGDVTTSGSTTTHALHSVTFVVNGGGSTIATGETFTYIGSGSTSGTINRLDISGSGSAGATCSITVDIWKRNAAIPTVANKISASAPATLSTANLSQSGSLTGWSTSVAANDVWEANVATVTGCIQAIVQVWYQ